MTFPHPEVLTPTRRGGARRRLRVLTQGPAMQDDVRAWALRAGALAGGVSAGISAVIYLVLTLHEYRIPFLQLWLAGTALLLVPWLLRVLHGPPAEPAPSFDPDRAEAGLQPFSQHERWRRRLDNGSEDTERFTGVVRSRLRTLVDQRLRIRHGVRLADDPARVQELLGRPLYEFLTEPLPRVPTPSELERLITRMEEI